MEVLPGRLEQGDNMFFESLWNEFALLPEVEAVALGGSRAGTHYDEKSYPCGNHFCLRAYNGNHNLTNWQSFCAELIHG